MKKYLRWSAAVATTALTCTLAVAPAQAQTVSAATGTSAQSTAPSGNLTPEQTKALIARIKSILPADYKERIAAAEQRLGVTSSETRPLVDDAIDPGQYQCSTTPLTTWLQNSIADLDINDLIFLVFSGALDIPTYDALFFGDGTQRQSFGQHGEYTRTLETTFRHLKSFWDIPSRDTQLVPMHGAMLTDKARVAHTAQYFLGVSPADAAGYAEAVTEVVNQPKFEYGAHPLFTFNSVSYASLGKEDFPGLGVLPNKIVMGDGVMEGYQAIGLGDYAPEAILAHEFGHQVQYADGLIQSDLTGPEASRRVELMADAFATYYLSHARGLGRPWKRTRAFLQVFYNVGDCSFTSSDHHGTPNQRMRAAEFGYGLSAHSRRHEVLSGKEFGRLFDKALPKIVAPDAT